jgi:PAS domain S-box-containing protein
MQLDYTDPFLDEKINFFRQFAENVDAIFWITDKYGKNLIFVNEQYEKLWGCSRQSLYDDPYSYAQRIHPEDKARAIAVLDELITDHQKYDEEYRVIRPDQSVVWVRDRGFPLRDEEGQVIYLAGVIEDITSLKQTAASLHKQTERLQNINQSVPGVIFQYTADQRSGEGEFTYLNSKASDLFEFDPSQVASPVQSFWNLVHPDDVARLRALSTAAVQNKTPLKTEHRIITPSGQEKWIQGQSEPATSPEGISVQHGVFIDISDRKRAEDERQRVEDELKQKNAELQAIYEVFPDLFFRMAADGTILDYKAGHTSDLYVSPEAFMGQRMQDVLLPSIGKLIDDAFAQALETGSLVGIEYSLLMASGEEFFEGRIVPLLEGQLIAIIRNISDRKMAQRVLETRVNQQAGVAQLGQQALANLELKLLMDKAAQLAATGLGVEYSKILELSPNQSSFLLRSGVGWRDGMVGQTTIAVGTDSQAGYALQSEKPVVVEDLNQEVRFSRSPLLESHQIVSGITVIIQGQQRAYGTLSAHSTSKRAFNQDDIYFLQAIANILSVAVERKETELAIQILNAMLEEQNQNLEALVEQRTAELATFINSLPDYIYVIQRHDNSIQFCNELFASVTRFKTYPETLGRTLMDCFPRRYANTCEAQNRQVFESGKPLHIQESFKLRDGLRPTGGHRTVHLDTYKIPLKRPNGEVYALITSARDITELLQARQALLERTIQLEATNRELDSFAYSVSHDLRAPLRHINGFVNALHQELTQNHFPLNPKITRYIQVIDNSSHKMGKLIDGLLTLSRVGRRDMHVQPVPLRSLVDSAIDLLSSGPQESCATPIEWDIHPLPTVKGDPALLQQVFTNLLNNALKFSRDRHPAYIEIGCLNEQILFVKDNGVGFSMKYADQLFGAFQRLHAQEEFEGTGIGLAIVQRIINRHGGKIWAKSEPGQGATFYFQLGSIILEEKNLY